LRIHRTELNDVLVIEPQVHADARGFFSEVWNERSFAELGLGLSFVQDNQSRSGRGVLRGLHYQLASPQGKLVRVTAGRIFDVAVDLRRSSKHFGQWTGHELSEANRLMVWIPPGFAHGFLCLEDESDVIYKCTQYYDPESERALAWNDPELGIGWPELPDAEIRLSQRDANAPTLARADLFP
jgi:dTDP-4-dehydrorhamnose 3,5-epimerase